MYDAELYRGKDEVERWKQLDPIVTFSKELRRQNLLEDQQWNQLETSVADEVAAAVAFAEAGPWESTEHLLQDVHARETSCRK